MLTSTAHIAVITATYSNGTLLLYIPSCLYVPGCVYKHSDNIRSNVIPSTWSIWHILCQGKQCTDVVFVSDKHLLVVTHFGKMVFLYNSFYILLIHIFVYYNSSSTFICFCYYYFISFLHICFSICDCHLCKMFVSSYIRIWVLGLNYINCQYNIPWHKKRRALHEN
jgi:hypothetical protein